MSTHDDPITQEHELDDQAPLTHATGITRDDLKALLDEERRNNGGFLFGSANPTASGQAPAAPTEPKTPEQHNRERAETALARHEEQARLDVLARALLADEEGYSESDLDAMSQTERLIEAGLDYSGETPQRRRARELREHDARILSDPAFAEQEQKRVEHETLESTWWRIPEQERIRKCSDLGLNFAEVNAAMWRQWGDRTGIPVGKKGEV